MINTRKRLQEQLKSLNPEEDKEAIREINQELRIIKGRLNGLSRTTSLEVLTDEGLLPNYAFPERGVTFYGAIYNKHRAASGDDHLLEYEIVRGPGSAIRELAPRNSFYTHSRVFEIQQIELGTASEPITEHWAVCGCCGHMRPKEQLTPDADPACPQCAHSEGSGAQADVGQQKMFVNFARSQALSYVEAYQSMSGDTSEERENKIYRLVTSFDLTAPSDVAAVADEGLPFGMEYRSRLVMRQVNGGYWEEPADMPFGRDKKLPSSGFRICLDCGIAAGANEELDQVRHRKSCRGRRETEKRQQQGQQNPAYRWESVFLYRELNSEAVRLLLPQTDPKDMASLTASLLLGMRLMLQGNPTHLLVLPESMPDVAQGVVKDYLVLMDAVPGGTGFLKTLFQKQDANGVAGEGFMEVLNLALNSLETCRCRRIGDQDDTDGCYRCIRNYQQQHKSQDISRERAIVLLRDLIKAGQRRKERQALDHINVQSLFGSMLEKRFIDRLREWVTEDGGRWDETIIKGGRGFRFRLKGDERYWDVQLQPELGPRDGVAIQCQPDFLLSCDDDSVKNLAVFTDGFDPHVHPQEPESRLPDDFQKRRAIFKSGNFHVWSITWDDLAENADHSFTVKEPVRNMMSGQVQRARTQGRLLPNHRMATGNPWLQFQAFLQRPLADAWREMLEPVVFAVASSGAMSCADEVAKDVTVTTWCQTGGWAHPPESASGVWALNAAFTLSTDAFVALHQEDFMERKVAGVMVTARLGDSAAERSGTAYKERWRRFLAGMNLFQFLTQFEFFAGSDHQEAELWAMPSRSSAGISAEWAGVLQLAVGSLLGVLRQMAERAIPVPMVEFYHDELTDDACAELAWKGHRIAVLVGDQASFATHWQNLGWKVVTHDELSAKSIDWFSSLFDKHPTP
jgi:DEAD/DEAH box helicase domain-containing protein